MTKLQKLFYKLGFWRLKRFRQWVGGRWVERRVYGTVHQAEHDLSLVYNNCRYRWYPDPTGKYRFVGLPGDTDLVAAIEKWPSRLPKARVQAATKQYRNRK